MTSVWGASKCGIRTVLSYGLCQLGLDRKGMRFNRIKLFRWFGNANAAKALAR